MPFSAKVQVDFYCAHLFICLRCLDAFEVKGCVHFLLLNRNPPWGKTKHVLCCFSKFTSRKDFLRPLSDIKEDTGIENWLQRSTTLHRMFEEEVRLGVTAKRTKRIPCYVSDTSHGNQSGAYMHFMRCHSGKRHAILTSSTQLCRLIFVLPTCISANYNVCQRPHVSWHVWYAYCTLSAWMACQYEL